MASPLTSLDLLEKMRTVLESESKKGSDKDNKISELDAKIAELEATNKQLTAEVASKEGECVKTRGHLATKGKQFDHLRAAVLAAAKAVVTGPPTTQAE
mmetsp:Transcript_41040/g.45738  ORF Transcript_41040/g.45738 Transcript_41040/m.45738 type:complete len:99 (+) Transcript_41040:279-575(+)